MAQKATIYKAQLEIADLDRHYYASHALTLACHPSETTRRMLCRLFVFAHAASESLAFTRGISTNDEPDLWDKSLSDEINLWIDIGQPEEKRIGKACGRADAVRIYGYEPRGFSTWWQQQQPVLERYKNLSVWEIELPDDEKLDLMLAKSMVFHCTIQENVLMVTDNTTSANILLGQKR